MSIDFEYIPSPSFVLDETLLIKNLELIQQVQERAGVNIILALKGFAMWSAFPIVKKYIKGAAASGLHEAQLIHEELGMDAHTYSPAFKDEDISEIIKYSSHITFNSLSQYKKYIDVLRGSFKIVSPGLRVNPEYSEVETELYNPCAPGSRLGITADQLGDELPPYVEGLHFHTLCESTSMDLEKTLKAFEEKFGKYLHKLKWVNFGGGHLMTREGYDIDHLVDLLIRFREKYAIEVILEPGSAFAWNTGYLVSSVIDVVENKGIKTAILDVSFAAHMPDCLEMPYQPRIVGADSNPVPGKPTYRMGGNSCLAGDWFGSWSFDKELKPGDKVVFEDMIHYTMVKTTFFNGVQHPSIGIWNETDGFRLVRKFGYEDYKQKLS